ncbi:MAG: hypothetical protein K6E84_04620 [Lachnospiraceae bacterium]|nr:hypothetical protein [Lachnospiraceae bacterium]
MDEKFTAFLITEKKIGKLSIAPLDILLLAATLVFGFLLRGTVFTIYGPKEAGTSSIFGESIDVMKGVSTASDYLMAAAAGYLVSYISGKKLSGYITTAILFLQPATVASSAMWGMADGFYLTCVCLFLLMILQKKTALAGLFLGLGTLFNPYALFLLPILLYGIFKRRSGEKVLLSVAALCYVAGGKLIHLFLMGTKIPPFAYEAILNKGRALPLLSYNYPNAYYMIAEGSFVFEYRKVGMILTVFLAMLILMLMLHFSEKRETGEAYRARFILEMSLFCCILLPFICPGMNERAGLMAMVIAVCLAMCVPAYYDLAILCCILAFLPTAAFFREGSLWPLSYVALAYLAAFLILYRRIVSGGKLKGEGDA